jgi:predicted DNA-binding transcriptional regulator AlpA
MSVSERNARATACLAVAAFLSDRDVAARYRVSRPTVWRWAGNGNLPPPVKLSQGATRWRLEDLLAFEAARGAA